MENRSTSNPPAPVADGGEILTRDAFESLVGDWTLGGPGGIRMVEMVLPIQNRLKQHDAALREEIAGARNARDIETELRTMAEARADRLAEALREIEKESREGDCACMNIAAAALKREEEKP